MDRIERKPEDRDFARELMKIPSVRIHIDAWGDLLDLAARHRIEAEKRGYDEAKARAVELADCWDAWSGPTIRDNITNMERQHEQG